MNKTLILLLLTVIVVVVVMVLPESGEQSKTIKIAQVTVESLSGINLSGKNKDIEIRKKSDSEWEVVTSDYAYPADKQKVNVILNSFKKDLVAEWVSGAEVYDRFGLGDNKLNLVLTSEDKTVLNISIGDEGSRSGSYYLKLSDDKNVYQASGDRTVFDKERNDFFDNSIISTSFDAIKIIRVINPKSKFKSKFKQLVLSKSTLSLNLVSKTNEEANKKPEPVWKDEKEKIYENEKIMNILNTLANLRAVGFDKRKPSEYVNSLLEVVAETDADKYQLAIREQKEDKTYLVSTPEERLSFVISELDGNRLLELKDLTSKKP